MLHLNRLQVGGKCFSKLGGTGVHADQKSKRMVVSACICSGSAHFNFIVSLQKCDFRLIHRLRLSTVPSHNSFGFQGFCACVYCACCLLGFCSPSECGKQQKNWRLGKFLFAQLCTSCSDYKLLCFEFASVLSLCFPLKLSSSGEVRMSDHLLFGNETNRRF